MWPRALNPASNRAVSQRLRVRDKHVLSAGAVIAALALAATHSGCFIYCPSAATAGCLQVSEIHQSAGREQDERLVGWMEDERSWVREEAARAAGNAGRTKTVSALEARLLDRDERPWVRAAAAQALGQIAAPGSFEVLVAVAGIAGAQPELQMALIQAICNYHRPASLKALTPLSSTEDALVSAYAEKAVRTECGGAK